MPGQGFRRPFRSFTCGLLAKIQITVKGIKVTTCQKCSALYSGAFCAPCRKLYSAIYYKSNKERIKSAARNSALSNPEKRIAANKKYYEKNSARIQQVNSVWLASNLDKVRVKSAEWALNNKAEISAKRAAYHIEHKVEINARSANWRMKNPNGACVHAHNYRARRLLATGDLSRGIYEKLLKIQRGLCACCGNPLGENSHLDHIMPLALGGSNTDNNMQLLTQKCNNEKHAKHPADFMRSRGFLI